MRPLISGSSRAGRFLPLTLAAAVTVGGLGACSSSPPDPRPMADALAAAMESGRFAGVPFANGTPEIAAEDLQTAVQRMRAAHMVRVRSTTVAEDGKTATATLAHVWDVDAKPADWTYETTAALVRREDSWAVQWSPAVIHPDLTVGARLVRSRRHPPRADIRGAGGAVLVTQRSVRVVGIDKTKVPAARAAASAAALARVVDVDAAAYAARVRSAGAEAFVEAVTLRLADATPLTARIRAVPGAVLLEDTLPLAPSRGFAAPILGRVGEATEEIVKASSGAVLAGDRVGLSGLQKRYDEQLRGSPGVTVQLVRPPAQGSGEPERRELFRSEPSPGRPLATTLDLAAQQRAESLLAAVKPASAIVAIRPSTGDVIAAASGPGGNGTSTATVGRFAPGSTFKVVTSLALLRRGLTPASPLPCTPRIVVNGKAFGNYSDYPATGLGRIPLTSALAYSCNTAFLSQHASVTQAALADAAAALGLGVDQDLGLPAFLGSVPKTAGATEHAASMIGQGKVEASPLAMAAVAASVVKGATVVPRVVLGGDAAAQPPAPASPVTAAEAQQLQALMRAVVERGSGRLLADVPAPPVGAKTGTAEYGSATPRRTHGWMIGFRGDLAVAVVVADAESGSRTAGPLLEAFLRQVR